MDKAYESSSLSEGIAEELRRKGEEMILQADAAEAFLNSFSWCSVGTDGAPMVAASG